MFSIFLKQNERYYLKILIFIVNKPRFTASDVQRLLKVSPSSVHRLIKALDSELRLLSDYSVKISKTDKIFYLFNNHSELSTTQLIKLLMAQFLRKSITFTILTKIILNKNIPVIKLAQSINISTSYLYNCLTDINKKLSPYQVQLGLCQQKIKLIGDETTVIIFLFLVSDSLNRFGIFDTKNSLYYRQNFQNISLKLNTTQQDTLSHLLTIANTRYSFQNDILIKNPDVLELLQHIVTQNNLLLRYTKLFDQESDSLLFYNLLERLIILTSEPDEQRILRGYQLYQIEHNELIDLTKKTIRHFQKQYLTTSELISADNFFETFYYLCLFSCCIDLLSIDYIYQFRYLDRQQLFEEDTRHYSKKEKHIQTIVGIFMSDYSKWDKEQKAAYTICVSRILYTNFSPSSSTKLSVFLHFPESIYTEQAVKKQLDFYFSDSFITYATDMSQADIVLSDRFISLPSKITFFLFYDIKSTDLWKKLFVKISTFLIS